MAIRIEFTMVNGEKYTVSTHWDKVFKKDENGREELAWGQTAFANDKQALVEMGTLVDGGRHFQCDQGVWVFAGRVVSARVFDDPNPETRMTPVIAMCTCCGQDFPERLRFRDRAGETWSGVLERYKKEGVCPLCYNTFGFVHGNVKMWSDEIWNAFINDKLKNIQDPQALKEVEAAAQKRDPDLAGRVRHKIAEIQAARKSATEPGQTH